MRQDDRARARTRARVKDRQRMIDVFLWFHFSGEH